jgi:antitoxin ParD1/3/4
MDITLTSDLENLINERMQSGLYNSPGEVIREGLRLLKEWEELRRIRREELRREIMKGVQAGQEGRSTVCRTSEELDEFGEKIIEAGMEELAQRKKAK